MTEWVGTVGHGVGLGPASGSTWRGSVILPAHDEADTIAGVLGALLQDAVTGEFSVVVACNGCTDETAAIARLVASETNAVAGDVTVLEIAQASKVAAIRAAERVIPDGPRLYLDADVVCPTGTARQLLDAVVTGGAPVAVPTREFDTRHLGRLALLYHRTWAELPWVVGLASGRGAYAMSQELRASLGEFPDVIADDRWGTTRCPPGDVATVPGVVVVSPPATLRDLVAVRSRVYAGNAASGMRVHETGMRARVCQLASSARHPHRLPGLVVFTTVTAVTKLRGVTAARQGRRSWGRARRLGPREVAAARAVPTVRWRKDLSIVVVTYRSAGCVGDCLAALRRECQGLSAEILVVDNDSGDHVADVVAAAAPEARFIARDRNDGFGRACHVGAAEASGARLLFCNPDAVVRPGAVSALLTCADAHPGAGVLGGRAVGTDGLTEPQSWWGRPSLWSALCFATGVSSLFPGHRVLDPESSDRWDGAARTVPVVSGGLMLVEAGAWQSLGGFDPVYLLYGEDADLCLRAWRQGFAPRVCPEATYVHSVGASSAGGNRLPMVLRGRVTVLRKSLPRPVGRLAGTLLVIGTGLRSVTAGLRPSSGRPSSGVSAWRHAWMERRLWREGWRPGDALASPHPAGPTATGYLAISGQRASLSESPETGSGHEMPSAGSS